MALTRRHKLWTLIALAGLSTAALAQEQAVEFEQAFRRLKRNDSLQFELAEAAPPAETPAWLAWIGEVFLMLFTFLGPIIYWAFNFGLGVLAFAVIYLLVQLIWNNRISHNQKIEDEPDTPLYQPTEKQVRILLDEVDALAAQGRYAEAVHRLLYKSIQDISDNRPGVIRRSLTAREIGRLSILTPQAREIFAEIAGVVETSHFGGQEIGRTEFDQARASYAQLSGQSWAVAA